MSFPRQGLSPRLGLLALLALTGFGSVWFTDARAQQTPQGRTAVELQVIPLRFAAASEVSTQLQQLLPSGMQNRVKIIMDPRTNSLLVSGTPEQLKEIQGYVNTLDTSRPSHVQSEEPWQVIFLRDLSADPAFEKVLQMAAPRFGIEYALDRQRKALIVVGEDQSVRAVRGLVERLESAPRAVEKVVREPAHREIQVRLVWLVSGPSHPKDAPKPPKDLKDVIAELARIGIEDLHLVSQVLIPSTEGLKIGMQGSAVFEGVPVRLGVQGQTTVRSGQETSLQLMVEVNEPGSDPAESDVCHIEAQIDAPFGHSVVLGVTPTRAATSVFVVQVTPKKTIPPVAQP